MNNLFKKIAAATIGAAMAIGMGVAFGRSSLQKAKADESLAYTLSAKCNSSAADSTDALSSSTPSDYLSSGASFVESVESNKIYLGNSAYESLKGGSSKEKGSITFNLSTSGQVAASKVVFTIAAANDTGKDLILSLNEETSGLGYKDITTPAEANSFNEYEVEWDGSTKLTSIKVEGVTSKSRFYLKSIQVYVEQAQAVTPVVADLVLDKNGPIELSGEDEQFVASTTIDYQVSYEERKVGQGRVNVTTSSEDLKATDDGNRTITISSAVEGNYTLTITTVDKDSEEKTVSKEVAVNVSHLKQFAAAELLKDASLLKAGDLLYIGRSEVGKAAGTIQADKDFLSSENATFLNEKLVSTESAIAFELGGQAGAWTLSYQDKLLKCTAAKKLAFGGNSGVETWTIEVAAEGVATIASTQNDFGKIAYNQDSPRFTTYTSDQGSVEIYRIAAKVVEHSVTFDHGEGSGEMDALSVVHGNSIENAPTCTFVAPEGKEFDKWLINDTPATFPLEVTDDIVLVASWKDVPAPQPQVTPSSLVVTYQGANPKVGETLQGEVSVHIKYSDDTVGQEDIAEQCSYYILINEQEYPVSIETKFEEAGNITIYAKYTPEDAESPIRGSVVITVDEKEVTPDPEPEENKVTIDFEKHSDLTPTVSNTVNGIKFIAAQNNGSSTPVLTQANSEQRHSLKLYASNTLTLELPENSSFKSFTSIQCLVTSKNDSTAGQGKYYKDSLESTAVYTHDLQTATFTESEKVNVSGAQKIIISCPLGQYRIAKIDLELSGDAPAPAQTFKVSFEHGEGASGEMDDLAKTEGAVISTAPACTFTAPEGKEFDKWVDSQGNAIVFPYTVNGNVTFVATWKDKVAPVDPEPSEAITCAQALAIVKALDEGAISTSTYKVRGVITSNFAVKESTQTAGTYQFNIADKDSDENQLIVWWASFKTAPKQGDTVVIEGKLQHFVDQKGTHKYEIVDGTGTIESSAPTPVDPEPVDPKPSEAITCAQALTAAKALDEGATSTNAYKVRGVITTKFAVKESSQVAGTYQFNIADKDSDEEQIVVWWAAFKTTPKQGDTVVIEGKLKHHVDQKGTKYEIVDGTGTIESSAPTPIDPEPNNPTSISLDKQTASIEVGKTVTLVATLAPAGATGTITWESSDSSVATVVNGVVTGVKAGSATISAKCGSLTPATCVITVTEQQSGGDPEPVDPTPTPVKTIDHIEVSGFNKVSYVIGQELDLSELKVLIYYSDNTFDVATAEQIKVEGYDKDKVGQQVVTVSVGDKTWTVRVVVYQGAVINELGCHGSLIAGSAIISLTSLLGAGLLFFRKKRI